MNKVYSFLMVIFLVTVCFGCKEEHLDLQELYELNAELAQEYFIGHWLEDYKVKFYIFEAKKATEYETGLCTYSNINLEDVENVVYARFNEDIGSPQIIAVEYKSVELAKESMNSKGKIRKENILAVNMASGYILLYGDYKTVDGCSLSLDGESLLFEDHFDYRSDIIIPEGVKYVLFPGLMGIYAKTIKCNEELEIIYDGAFSNHITQVEPKGLGENEITEEEAKGLIEKFIDKSHIKEIVSNGLQTGTIEVYNFNVLLNDEKNEDNYMSISITKKGGQVLYLAYNRSYGAVTVDIDTAKQIGQEYLANAGFGDMRATYHMNEGNSIIYVVKNKEIVIPPKRIIDWFTSVISSMFEQQKNLTTQIRHLTEARDRLLPKLMSGEIKV